MMIEPGNMIRTFEAYRTMRDHLTDNGVLAIWYPRGLDSKGILTKQYVQTLRSLKMNTEAFRNDAEFLILAFRHARAKPPSPAQLGQMLTLGEDSFALTAEFRRLEPQSYPVADDPQFVPITDQKPFLAGNVRYILSMPQVAELCALGIATLAAATCAVWWSLRRRGDPQIPGVSFAGLAGLAFLIGANFLMMEHTLVLTIFRRLYVYDDALALAAIGFLVLSGLGSLLAVNRFRLAFAALAALAMTLLLFLANRLAVYQLFLAMAPLGIASGMFFPAVFEAASRNPVAVFAFDALGAGAAALAATFIPIVWGIDAFLITAGFTFLATVAAATIFYRACSPRPSIARHSAIPAAVA
jgi:hypothetical protein